MDFPAPSNLCRFCLSLGVLGLASCSVSQPFPDRAAFALTPGHPEKSAAAKSELTLRVKPLRIAKPYDSQLFNYKIGAQQFTQDYYAGFIAPPENLLGAQLIDWLEDSGAVKYAVAAGARMDCSANLEPQISALYADHTNKTAVIELRIFVISDAVGPTQIMLQKVYRETEPLASTTPETLVTAWSAAYRRILTQLTADLAALPVPAH